MVKVTYEPSAPIPTVTIGEIKAIYKENRWHISYGNGVYYLANGDASAILRAIVQDSKQERSQKHNCDATSCCRRCNPEQDKD